MSEHTPRPEDLFAEGALTVAAASDFSGLSRTELYRLMDGGELAYFRPRKDRLIPKRALIDYLAARYAADQAERTR